MLTSLLVFSVNRKWRLIFLLMTYLQFQLNRFNQNYGFHADVLFYFSLTLKLFKFKPKLYFSVDFILLDRTSNALLNIMLVGSRYKFVYTLIIFSESRGYNNA